MAESTLPSLVERCRTELDARWREQLASGTQSITASIPSDVISAIARSVNSNSKTFRYVLPTQILAKLVDPSLDCRCIQEGASLSRAFDARTICHSVIVPFDRNNHNVLGGSAEPYVSNPLRIASLTSEFRHAQKNKNGFDDLCLVLDHAQRHAEELPSLMNCVLGEIANRLQSARIVYPVPNRISIKQTLDAVASLISARTGGARLQAVAVALFQTIGSFFRIFEQVRSADVNAADASTGAVADLECVNGNEVVLAVEVKDRRLTLRHLQDKLPAARERGIKELFFLVQGGVEQSETQAVDATIDREFVTGQNIYVCEFDMFFRSCLSLFAERGRREFLLRVGEALDARSDLVHRTAWRDILQSV